MIPRRHPHLALPLAFASALAGASMLALLGFHAPRAAIVLVFLSLIVTLAILSELIFGDR